MIIDNLHNFGIPAITTSNSVTKGTNDYDAGASVKHFGNPAGEMRLTGKVSVTAGTSPTVTVKLIASDESDLDVDNSEESNDVLATFFTDMKEDGSAALASGDEVHFNVPIQQQKVPRRYYGIHVQLGGTNPSCSAGDCQVVRDAQTNMLGPS